MPLRTRLRVASRPNFPKNRLVRRLLCICAYTRAHAYAGQNFFLDRGLTADFFFARLNMNMSREISRPIAWFRPGQQTQTLRTNAATVIEPHQQETEALLCGKLCAQCVRFDYERGQKLIKKTWFMDMLRRDCSLSNLADNVDPRELGGCEVQPDMLTHRFAGADCKHFSHREGWLGRLKGRYY